MSASLTERMESALSWQDQDQPIHNFHDNIRSWIDEVNQMPSFTEVDFSFEDPWNSDASLLVLPFTIPAGKTLTRAFALVTSAFNNLSGDDLVLSIFHPSDITGDTFGYFDNDPSNYYVDTAIQTFLEINANGADFFNFPSGSRFVYQAVDEIAIAVGGFGIQPTTGEGKLKVELV